MLNHDFTVIGLSETWLNYDDSDLYGLCGYKVIGHHRVNRAGGGWRFVFMFISKKDQTSPILMKIVKQSSLKCKGTSTTEPQCNYWCNLSSTKSRYILL